MSGDREMFTRVDMSRYSEIIDLLYTSHTLSFGHPITLLSLPKSIVPHSLNRIRSVQLYWRFEQGYHTEDVFSLTERPYDQASWNEACGVLARMQGLRHLRVYCGGMGAPWNDRGAEPALKPLREVKQVERVEVVMSARWRQVLFANIGGDGESRFVLLQIPRERFRSGCVISHHDIY